MTRSVNRRLPKLGIRSAFGRCRKFSKDATCDVSELMFSAENSAPAGECLVGGAAVQRTQNTFGLVDVGTRHEGLLELTHGVLHPSPPSCVHDCSARRTAVETHQALVEHIEVRRRSAVHVQRADQLVVTARRDGARSAESTGWRAHRPRGQPCELRPPGPRRTIATRPACASARPPGHGPRLEAYCSRSNAKTSSSVYATVPQATAGQSR